MRVWPLKDSSLKIQHIYWACIICQTPKIAQSKWRINVVRSDSPPSICYQVQVCKMSYSWTTRYTTNLSHLLESECLDIVHGANGNHQIAKWTPSQHIGPWGKWFTWTFGVLKKHKHTNFCPLCYSWGKELLFWVVGLCFISHEKLLSLSLFVLYNGQVWYYGHFITIIFIFLLSPRF